MTGAAELLDALPRHETAHGALLADIVDVLRGAPAPSTDREPLSPAEELSPSELRVLRYLPTNLTRPEIARELYVSDQHGQHAHPQHLLQARCARSLLRRQRARELRLLSTGHCDSADERQRAITGFRRRRLTGSGCTMVA